MATRFAHRDMLLAGLTWLASRISAAASVFDIDRYSPRLWITLNESAPASCDEAWEDKITGREIFREEVRHEDNPILEGPTYVDSDAVLRINTIGSMRGIRDGIAICACFLTRVGTTSCDLFYMASVVSGGITAGLPVTVGPWCVRNTQPAIECELQ